MSEPLSEAKIAVTGSTGALGGLVARGLAEKGASIELLVRDPGRAPQLPGVPVHRFSYTDRDASIAALTGVPTLFMVSASESADRVDQHRSFVDAAAAAGVQHIVYTSFLGAAADATFTLARDHHATEEHIRASGLRWTFLRDSFYLDFLPGLVGEDETIRGPAGEGKCAFVARADVARTAVAVLLAPSQHRDRQYDLTGPEALSLDEVAGTLSRNLGRPIVFRNETLDEAYASRASSGAPPWQLDAWVSTYVAIGSGGMEPVSSAVQDITGTVPSSFSQFLSLPPL